MKTILLMSTLFLSLCVTTVNAQEPLTDGERIIRLEETVYNHLATKADLERFRSDILIATKTDIATLRSELEVKISALESRIANNSYITWGIIVIVSILGGKVRQFLRLESEPQ